MAVQLIESVGSWDRKTANFGIEASIYERDTGRKYDTFRDFPTYRYTGTDSKPARGFHEHQDSSMAHLLGHEFAKTEPALFNLLTFFGNPTTVISTGVSYSTSNIGALSGYTVARFNGSSNISIRNDDLFGTDSYLIGAWFRPGTINRPEDLFSYSDGNNTEIRVSLLGTNRIEMRIADGMIPSTFITFAAGHIRNDDWHYIGILYDKTAGTASLLVSNGTQELAIYEGIAITTGNFDRPDSYLVIGGRRTTTISTSTYVGDASNLQVYTWPNEIDFNVIQLVLAGIREPPAHDIIISNTIDPSKRLNNDFSIRGDAGSYTYALVNLDEGKYQQIITHHFEIDGTTYGMFFDHIDQGRFDLHAPTVQFGNRNAFLTDVDAGKGLHWVKLQLYGPGQASFSQLKWNKIDGDNVNGASSFIMLGDELADSTGLQLSSSTGNHFTSELSTIGDVPDGSYAQGELYLRGGLWRLSLHQSQLVNAGITELLINGIVVMREDGYGQIVFDDIITRQVVLSQGRNVIRLQINGKNADSTGYRMLFHALRGELQSNSTFQDRTIWTGADVDNEIIIGEDTHHTHVIYDGAFLGSEYRASTEQATSGRKRGFAGGLYVIRYHIRRQNMGGNQTVRIGTRNILTVGFDNPNEQNTVITTIAKIPRGYHDVIISNIDGSFSPMSLLDCHCIARMPVPGDAPVEISNNDGLVLMGEYEARRPEGAHLMELGSANPAKYDYLECRMRGRATAAMAIGANINGITAAQYRKTGDIKLNGQQHGDVNSSEGELVLVTDGLLQGDSERFRAGFELEFEQEFNNIVIVGGKGSASTHPYGHETTSWSLVGNDVPQVDDVLFHSTENWHTGAKIRLYGRLKTDGS